MPDADRESMTITADDVATLNVGGDAPPALECEHCEATRASFKPPGKCGHLDTCKLCTCHPQPRVAELPKLEDVDVVRLSVQHADPKVRACATELIERRNKESGKTVVSGKGNTKSPPMTSKPKSE